MRQKEEDRLQRSFFERQRTMKRIKDMDPIRSGKEKSLDLLSLSTINMLRAANSDGIVFLDDMTAGFQYIYCE